MTDRTRLLVLSPNWLGDAVMALPAIDDLRRRLDARIVVAARSSVSRLFTLVPWVEEIVELEWRGGLGDIGTLLRDIARLRAVKADVALLLPNSFASAWLAFAARVPQRWGYATDGRALLLTRAISSPRGQTPFRRPRGQTPSRGQTPLSSQTSLSDQPPSRGQTPSTDQPGSRGQTPLTDQTAFRGQTPFGGHPSVHQGAYYQHLVRALGAATGPLEPRIAVTAAQTADARALLTASGWDGERPLVVFAPGAAYGMAKRWWPTHFATLAAHVIATHRAQIVLVGSGADTETTGEILGLLPPSAVPSVMDLAGRTTLEMLAAVLSLARVCISNDSGAMHLAAAVGAPLAAIFGPTNEHETSPLVHAPMELLIHAVPCRPCMLRECPIDHPCMRDLTPDRVGESVARMLVRPEVTP